MDGSWRRRGPPKWSGKGLAQCVALLPLVSARPGDDGNGSVQHPHSSPLSTSARTPLFIHPNEPLVVGAPLAPPIPSPPSSRTIPAAAPLTVFALYVTRRLAGPRWNRVHVFSNIPLICLPKAQICLPRLAIESPSTPDSCHFTVTLP